MKSSKDAPFLVLGIGMILLAVFMGIFLAYYIGKGDLECWSGEPCDGQYEVGSSSYDEGIDPNETIPPNDWSFLTPAGNTPVEIPPPAENPPPEINIYVPPIVDPFEPWGFDYYLERALDNYLGR